MRILAIDPGTTQSAYALLSDAYQVLSADKVENSVMMDIIASTPGIDAVIIEDMEPRYPRNGKDSNAAGAIVGASTYTTLKWMGKFDLTAQVRGIAVHWIYRRDERAALIRKKELPADAPKHADGQIRAALITRFAAHDKVNGKGTKAKPDTFYGVSGDMWQAIAVGVTWLDKQRTGGGDGCGLKRRTRKR